jgi:mono/diheme cytochrome c family protein
MRWTAAFLRAASIAAMVASTFAASAARGAESAGRSDGALLFHNYCSVCHGDKGDGKSRASGALSTPPRDFTSEASRRELTRERVIAAVTNGVPGTAMVGWRTQLAPADIERVADHVLARFVLGGTDTAVANAARQATPGISGTRAHGGRQADAASTSAPVDMTAGLPNGLKGDVKRGGAFYTANCATCHGLRGDGAGPRAYFINPKPRDFTAAASRASFNRLALFAAVSEGRNGSEMPAWSKVASPQQIADVCEYVFQAFIQGRAELGAAPR